LITLTIDRRIEWPPTGPDRMDLWVDVEWRLTSDDADFAPGAFQRLVGQVEEER
jgi:hypothetical protein